MPSTRSSPTPAPAPRDDPPQGDPARLPGQIEYAGGELLLRGVELPPEELAAVNQRLAADGYAARSQDGALLLRPQERP